jgi:outer membrane lipoprotein SlyB
MKKLYFIFVLVMGLALTGCQNDNNSKTISTDVVKNEKTLKAMEESDLPEVSFAKG